MDYIYIALTQMALLTNADNAGTNKAANSCTSLNTKRLDDDTENLAREFHMVSTCTYFKEE
jgi:hypothetical protein